ncbi:MAG: LPP20 family lipoprotein [Planctomycetes bacterium]|nr:LPP20 family lipoprotein [Planctomycetota bacterium]
MTIRGYALTIALGAAPMLAGSGCAEEEVVPEREMSPAQKEIVEKKNIPEWILVTPLEPGKAFYAGAVGTAKGTLSIAMDSADAAARAKLAEVLKVKIQAVLSQYVREVQVPGEKEPVNEAHIQNVIRTVLDTTVSGSQILKREPAPGGEWYALARISFDDVAIQLKTASEKQIKAVAENRDKAFAEMDKLLKEQSEK